MKTPGQFLYESQGSPVPYAELDERVRRQFELEGAAVWNAALDAARQQWTAFDGRLFVPVNHIEALKVRS